MDQANPKKRRLWWDVLRVGVTLGALGWVLLQITWQDRLLLDDGKRVEWGWTEKTPAGTLVLVAHDGQKFPIPSDDLDRSYIPGFWTLLKGIDVWILLAALVLFPVSIVLASWRWQLLLRTHELDPGFREATRLTWIGMLSNNVLPGSTGGDVVKGMCIYRRTPGKRMAAVMTVFMDRAVGLVSLMAVGAVAILMQAGRPELEAPSRLVLGLLFVVLGGGAVFFSGRIRRLFRVSEIIARLPFNQQIRKIDDSVFHYRDHVSVLIQGVAISVLMHIWTIVCVYLLGESLQMPVSLIDYFVFLPVIWTGSAFVPSIAGLGVMEGLFQQLFSLPGVGATPSSAVALCILYRMMVLIGSAPGAIPAYRESSMHGVRILGAPVAPIEESDEPSIGDVKAAC